jgi:hypothetical protein
MLDNRFETLNTNFDRRTHMTTMATTATNNREALEDLWYGQVVTIVARWFLIGAGVVLTLWRAEAIGDVMAPIYLLLGLVAVNFVLHGRFLTGKPMRREVIVACCIVDVAVISLVIASASWRVDGGINNPFYIFYYPVILSFALVFPQRLTWPFTLGTIAVYLGVCFLSQPEMLQNESLETAFARSVTMATAAFLGNMFWRIERQWRREQLAARRGA